jgi:hypothetical protein
MRSHQMSIALAGAGLLAACGAPPDALVSRCSTPALSLVTTCELTAGVLRQERSAFIDGGSGNARVRVKARFAVRTGQVTVALPCANGRYTVTPDEPVAFECEATIDRGSQKIRIDATPNTPGPEGLSGTLELRPL